MSIINLRRAESDLDRARSAVNLAKSEWNAWADRVEDLTATVGFDHPATQAALEIRAETYDRLRAAQDRLIDALDQV